jgi:hypothetical protein
LFIQPLKPIRDRAGSTANPYQNVPQIWAEDLYAAPVLGVFDKVNNFKRREIFEISQEIEKRFLLSGIESFHNKIPAFD